MIVSSGQAQQQQRLPVRQESTFTPPEIRTGRQLDPSKLEGLRKKINSAEYMNEAIQRIALILSNELLDISHEGLYHYERQRKGRK
jgi:hypothetical protein